MNIKFYTNPANYYSITPVVACCVIDDHVVAYLHPNGWGLHHSWNRHSIAQRFPGTQECKRNAIVAVIEQHWSAYLLKLTLEP